jgi:uncharacterized membrane protein YqjE
MISQEIYVDFMLKSLRERILLGICFVFGVMTLLAAVALIVVALWERSRRHKFWHRLAKSRRVEQLPINGAGDNGNHSDDGFLLRSVAQQHREHLNAVALEVLEWRTMQSEIRSQLHVLNATVQKIQNDPSRLPSLMKVD